MDNCVFFLLHCRCLCFCLKEKKMSNPRKRNFRIEGFKRSVVMDPTYGDITWIILENAIHQIYDHNASGLSFEELYRLVFRDFYYLLLVLRKICVYMMLICYGV